MSLALRLNLTRGSSLLMLTLPRVKNQHFIFSAMFVFLQMAKGIAIPVVVSTMRQLKLISYLLVHHAKASVWRMPTGLPTSTATVRVKEVVATHTNMD